MQNAFRCFIFKRIYYINMMEIKSYSDDIILPNFLISIFFDQTNSTFKDFVAVTALQTKLHVNYSSREFWGLF